MKAILKLPLLFEDATGLRLRTFVLSLVLGLLLVSILLLTLLNLPASPLKIPNQTFSLSGNSKSADYSSSLETESSASSLSGSSSAQTVSASASSPIVSTPPASSSLSSSAKEQEEIDEANRYARKIAESIASSEEQAGAIVHIKEAP